MIVALRKFRPYFQAYTIMVMTDQPIWKSMSKPDATGRMVQWEVEYVVILTNLKIAKVLGVKNLKLRTNSKLIVGQITNEYEAKEERMKRYLKLTNRLVDYFDDIKFKQIPW